LPIMPRGVDPVAARRRPVGCGGLPGLPASQGEARGLVPGSFRSRFARLDARCGGVVAEGEGAFGCPPRKASRVSSISRAQVTRAADRPRTPAPPAAASRGSAGWIWRTARGAASCRRPWRRGRGRPV